MANSKRELFLKRRLRVRNKLRKMSAGRVRLFNRADGRVADAVVRKRDLPLEQLFESRRDRVGKWPT